MVQIENEIKQASKEYLLYKGLFDERVKGLKDKEAQIAKISTTKTEEELDEIYFDEIGSINYLSVDLNQAKIKLYHYINLVKDVLEVPEEIRELVSDYKQAFVFTTTGEIVDNGLFEKYKAEYINNIRLLNEQLKQRDNRSHMIM